MTSDTWELAEAAGALEQRVRDLQDRIRGLEAVVRRMAAEHELITAAIRRLAEAGRE